MRKIQSSPHIYFLKNEVLAKDEVSGPIPDIGSNKKFPLGIFLLPMSESKQFCFRRNRTIGAMWLCHKRDRGGSCYERSELQT